MEENTTEEKKALPSLHGAEPLLKAEAIGHILDDKKGHEIKILKVGEKTSIAEYFVICTGGSGTQVKALAGEVEYKMGQRDVDADNVEGRGNNSWIVLDYGDVIVHIFNREARSFYNLDKLYGDSETVFEF